MNATHDQDMVPSPHGPWVNGDARLVHRDIAKRQRIERKVCSKVIRDALVAGFSISVYDGEATVLRKATSLKPILKAMFSVDDERLYFYAGQERHEGSVLFVYGNDGCDVIADYSAKDGSELQKLLEAAMDWASDLDS